MSKHDGVLRCDHCDRRIGGSRFGIRRGDLEWNFCGDRRECRRACHEEGVRGQSLVVSPPASSSDLAVETYGAALTGFDYVDLPWWMRWMPDRWLDGLRRDVAVKVGGMVERRLYVKANGLEDRNA